ncbi:hypothetical protein F0562_031079 [Nyssa sinensis]|uniref:Uncharacterized protein n=1 Tax=Nyssa sinensis TaxID=561372 RepID=A0A5J5AVJ9_9ASTE|nr:hypothetical protein F0562_031079 [Nyssa sinensis]
MQNVVPWALSFVKFGMFHYCKCDDDVWKMVTYVPPNRVIEVYLEHVSAIDFLHNQIGLSNAGSSHVAIEEIDIGDVDYNADIETQGAIVKAIKGISLKDGELETDDFEFIDSDYSISDDDDELFEKNVDEGIEWGSVSRSKGKGANAEVGDDVTEGVNTKVVEWSDDLSSDVEQKLI